MADIKVIKKVTVADGKPYSIIVTNSELDGIVAAAFISEGIKTAYHINHIIMCSDDLSSDMTEKMITKADENVEKFSGIVYIIGRELARPEFLNTYATTVHWVNYNKESIDKYFDNKDAYASIEEYLSIDSCDSSSTLAYELMLDLFTYQDTQIDERVKSRLARWSELTGLWSTNNWKKDSQSDDSKIAKKLAFVSKILSPSMLYDFVQTSYVMDAQLKFAADIYVSKFKDACTSALLTGKVCTMKGYKFMVLRDGDSEFMSKISDYCFNKYDSDVVLYIKNSLVSARVKNTSDFNAIGVLHKLSNKAIGDSKYAECKLDKSVQEVLDTIRGILG